MGSVVNLTKWRREREAGSQAIEASARLMHPSGNEQENPHEVVGVDRLERAVKRLHEIVSQALDLSGHVQPHVETELLAIMGELTMGLVTDAAVRAERLADQLATGK
jgi:predicted xylose isomerase-like sugar epimerase